MFTFVAIGIKNPLKPSQDRGPKNGIRKAFLYDSVQKLAPQILFLHNPEILSSYLKINDACVLKVYLFRLSFWKNLAGHYRCLLDWSQTINQSTLIG